MTLERIINKLSGFFSGLYYRQWETWELIALAVAVAIVILLILRAHLKVAANERRLRERSPIVGVRMAHHGRRHL